jgi:hypothetical protein
MCAELGCIVCGNWLTRQVTSSTSQRLEVRVRTRLDGITESTSSPDSCSLGCVTDTTRPSANDVSTEDE